METDNEARNKIPITVLILIYFLEVHIPIYWKNSFGFFNLK